MELEIEILETDEIPTSYIEKDYSKVVLNKEDIFSTDLSKVINKRVESKHYMYKIRAKKGDREYIYDYFQGGGCSREIEDVKRSAELCLFFDACLIIYNPKINTINDYMYFAHEYGYKTDDIQAYKVWKECKKAYDFLTSIGFTDNEILKRSEE